MTNPQTTYTPVRIDAVGNLHLPTVDPIPLTRIESFHFTDEPTKTTPGWAIAAAIFLFPIGLLALFAKREIPNTRVTVYVKGNPTPITVWGAGTAHQTQTDWYPILSTHSQAVAAHKWAPPSALRRVG